MTAFRTHDGVELACRFVEPAGVPRAVVVLAPGFGEHIHLMSWELAAAALAAAGFVVAGFDYRGHGQSPGQRGHVERWQQLRDDFREFRVDTISRWPRVPVCLAGLSLGAAVVLDAAIDQPESLVGVVAVAAPVGEIRMSKVARSLAAGLARIAPRFPLRPSLSLNSLSRDESVGAAYLADPLFHQRATARGVNEALGGIAHLRRRAADLHIPLLMLHGSADGIAVPDERFFATVSSADKTRRLFDGAKHNLFIESNRDEIFDAMTEWIAARV